MPQGGSQNIYETKYTPPKLISQYSPHSQQLKSIPRLEHSHEKREVRFGGENKMFKQVRMRAGHEELREKIGMGVEKRLFEVERNVYRQPEGRLRGEKARPIFGHDRRGRSELSSVRTNSLSNSKSKESSFIYI